VLLADIVQKTQKDLRIDREVRCEGAHPLWVGEG